MGNPDLFLHQYFILGRFHSCTSFKLFVLSFLFVNKTSLPDHGTECFCFSVPHKLHMHSRKRRKAAVHAYFHLALRKPSRVGGKRKTTIKRQKLASCFALSFFKRSFQLLSNNRMCQSSKSMSGSPNKISSCCC